MLLPEKLRKKVNDLDLEKKGNLIWLDLLMYLNKRTNTKKNKISKKKNKVKSKRFK